ncbi:methylthioribulose 1-phosphate dehydratase [Actinokineospora auranticolor]|uniref:Methylthioribulose-1-phosphate dehydratase n=1 Tax=Actinokineospora auranticolor TaxID=155976 RepID=A0A2S6GD70_9PSEU|nr:methylthioribulose 1-phosphate dehydratase [Actinokineospora auranticolor]PPK63152.1 methylthioribulose-1-phosphate dehydratase [Actinokineospora auranticolor]
MTVFADLGLDLAAAAARLYAKGWMEGTAGNLSVRLPGGDTALITARGRGKGELTTDDVVEVRIADSAPVDPDGPRPSAETSIHTALYRLFPDCGAVVHAHPPYATVLSLRGGDRARFSGLEIIKGLGATDQVSIPVLPNWPDVPRIAADATRLLGPHAPPALLIAGHGATTWAPTLAAARHRMECVESLARLTHLLTTSPWSAP